MARGEGAGGAAEHAGDTPTWNPTGARGTGSTCGTGPTRGAGRYAPSPSGDLHLGNLRTAVLAWLYAKHSGREFHLRIDDIDAQRSSPEVAERQLADLAAIGITHDGPIATQQQSLDLYKAALEKLAGQGRVYECYCSRRDIQDASRAPHSIPGQYPQTCRDLTDTQREQRRSELAEVGRAPALRLRSEVSTWTVTELLQPDAADPAGAQPDTTYTGDVDDLVLRRGGNTHQLDGTEYAYNLAVVVDDATAGVNQVVRGADLLSSAPRQAYLAHLLGLPPVEYLHVPLVLGPEGKRLAKRDGAVTMRELGVDETRAWIANSLGEAVRGNSADEWLETFHPELLPAGPVTFSG